MSSLVQIIELARLRRVCIMVFLLYASLAREPGLSVEAFKHSVSTYREKERERVDAVPNNSRRRIDGRRDGLRETPQALFRTQLPTTAAFSLENTARNNRNRATDQ